MTSRSRSAKTSRRARQVVSEFNRKCTAQSSPPSERSLSNLTHALSQKRTSKPTKKEHTQIWEMLPFYVADEQRGADVAQVYPEIWTHLQSCDECRELHDLLARPASTTGVPLRANRQALKTAEPSPGAGELAWSLTPLEDPHGILITLSPKFVRALWTSAANAPAVRTSSQAETPILLLSDSAQVGSRTLFFSAWLERPETPRTLPRLRVRASGASPRSRLTATLRWNGKLHQARREKTDLLFDNIPVPVLARARQPDPTQAFVLELRLK